MQARTRIWIARILVGLVLLSNLYAAVSFLLAPNDYAPGFELKGEPGRVVVLGTAVLFIMWQVPYVFALVHPLRQHTALTQAAIMQGIGLAGETWILQGIPEAHSTLRGSILRFIVFDAAGLLLLILALLLVHHSRGSVKES